MRRNYSIVLSLFVRLLLIATCDFASAQVLDKQKHWVMKGQTFMDHAASSGVDLATLDVRQTFRDHIYGCVIEDHHGVGSLDEIGEDNVMCETDYPHSDSTWPHSRKVAMDIMRDLDDDTIVQIVRTNAIRMLRLEDSFPV